MEIFLRMKWRFREREHIDISCHPLLFYNLISWLQRKQRFAIAGKIGAVWWSRMVRFIPDNHVEEFWFWHRSSMWTRIMAIKDLVWFLLALVKSFSQQQRRCQHLMLFSNHINCIFCKFGMHCYIMSREMSVQTWRVVFSRGFENKGRVLLAARHISFFGSVFFHPCGCSWYAPASNTV